MSLAGGTRAFFMVDEALFVDRRSPVAAGFVLRCERYPQKSCQRYLKVGIRAVEVILKQYYLRHCGPRQCSVLEVLQSGVLVSLVRKICGYTSRFVLNIIFSMPPN